MLQTPDVDSGSACFSNEQTEAWFSDLSQLTPKESTNRQPWPSDPRACAPLALRAARPCPPCRALPATGQLKDPQTPEPALHSHTVLLGHVLPAVPSLPCCGPAERPSDLRACAHHSHTVLLGRALPACLPCHALPACPPCRAAGQPKGSQTGAHWPVIWVLVSNVSNHPSDLSLVS